MKTAALTVAFFMTIVSTANAVEPLADCSSQIQDRLDAAVGDIFKDTGIPDGVGAYCFFSMRGAELSLRSGRIAECGPDHFFRIASGTKMFTAAAAAMLIADGKFALDDRITPLIPPDYDIPDGDRITVHMLLNHKSGIFDPTNSEIPADAAAPCAGKDYTDFIQESDPAHDFTCDEFFKLIGQLRLQTGAPGRGNYCNMNYALLNKIIERATGKTAERYIEETLIVPFGLASTYFPSGGGDRDLAEPFIRGFKWRDRAAGSTTDATRRNPTVFIGSGNIVSTPRDMTRFVRKLFTRGPGCTMLPPPGEDYGLGIMSKGSGFGNDGAFNGYYSMMFYNPELDLAWCIVINLCDFSGDFGFQVNRMTEFQNEAAAIVKTAVENSNTSRR